MWNKITIGVVVLVLGLALVGCGAAAKMIVAKSQSERADVFQEISGAEAIPAGYADLTIRANIKTHVEGYYIGESKESAHGKEVYPFLINIDEQAVLWKVKGEKHQLPKYVDGKTSRDPEAGEGMKYVLDKKVRLAAGKHTVFFGLPGEPYFTTTEISVKDAGQYVLEFKPGYKYKTSPTRIPTFLKGVSSFEALFTMTADRAQ
ncbi:MAG TPA: hypothetical protein VI956_03515 [Nitrospirota bacterium]|nr:hypothetical protein [Nitrospirota bacterium]